MRPERRVETRTEVGGAEVAWQIYGNKRKPLRLKPGKQWGEWQELD